jgi:hypothetical protein
MVICLRVAPVCCTRAVISMTALSAQVLVDQQSAKVLLRATYARTIVCLKNPASDHRAHLILSMVQACHLHKQESAQRKHTRRPDIIFTAFIAFCLTVTLTVDDTLTLV